MKVARIFFLFFFLCFGGARAQAPVYEIYDCNFFKEVLVPFDYSVGPTAVKHNLHQTVFYSYRDQFTYWYKVVVKENAEINFKIDPINDSDSYAVFVYQYNANDFCKKLYNQKIQPLKKDFFIRSTDDLFDLTEKKFKARKDSVYYISVINTSLNNCGHNLSMCYGKDTLHVKAVHIPCKRDIETLSVKTSVIQKKTDSVEIKKMPPVEIKSDPVKAGPKEFLLLCVIKNKVTNAPVDYKPMVTDEASQEELPIQNINKGEWIAKVVSGNSYKVKCTLLGYKSTTVNVTAGNDTTKTSIALEPLKVGDVFVMKSIYFHPNTYALKRESIGELQKLLNYLNNNPTASIEIQGHTNGDHRVAKNKAYESLGPEWNFSGSAKELSLKRAEAIKKFLETNGIPESRLVPKGYGGKKPIIRDPQTNEEGQMNIRVEVVILTT